MLQSIGNSLSGAWEGAKNLFTIDDKEQFRRRVRRWSSHAVFAGSTLFGAGLGLALRDAVTGPDGGPENIVLGQASAAFDAVGADEATREGVSLALGLAAGMGVGKIAHRQLRPETVVEINLPEREDRVGAEEAQRILRRQQRETVFALEDAAKAVGVEESRLEEAHNSPFTIGSLKKAIQAKVDQKPPAVWQLRTRELEEEIALQLLSGIKETHGDEVESLVRAVTAEDEREQIQEMTEVILEGPQEAAENGQPA